MTRDHLHEAVRRMATYSANIKLANLAVVGTGNYALVGVEDDGSRHIHVTGFDSAFDAELYATMLAEQPVVDPQPGPRSIFDFGFGLPSEPPKKKRRTTRYEIVALVPAIPASALDALRLEGQP